MQQRAVLAIGLVALVARAAMAEPSGPISNTLARALKLFRKGAYFSANIELSKVLAGEAGDNDANRQRAQFIDANALFEIGFYAEAAAKFEAIARKGPQHAYYTKAPAGLAAGLGHVALDAIGSLAFYEAVETPAQQADADQLAYARGLLALRVNQFDRAAASFATVSERQPYARLALGLADLGLREAAKGHDVLASVPVGDAGDLAALANAEAFVREAAWDRAFAAYARVRATGPYGARAAWELAWAHLAQRGEAPKALARLAIAEVRDPEQIEPAVLPTALAFDVCAGRAGGASAALVGAAPGMKHELREVLASGDAVIDAVLSPRVQALVHALWSAGAIAGQRRWLAELDRELAMWKQTDKAWQTTNGALQVLADLTLRRGRAKEKLDQMASARLEVLVAELDTLAAAPSLDQAALAIRCR